MSTKRILLKVTSKRLMGKGFGSYLVGSAKKDEARITVDLDAMAWAVTENKGVRFKEIFLETLTHEFAHAMQDLLGLTFNCRKIERMIARQPAPPSRRGRRGGSRRRRWRRNT